MSTLLPIPGLTADVHPMEPAAPSSGAAPSGRFESWLTRIEQAEKQTNTMMTDLARGETGNLHRLMLGIEQNRIEFELFLQMRNRALEAYQELMRMQV